MMSFSFLTAWAITSASLGGGRPGEGAPQGIVSSSSLLTGLTGGQHPALSRVDIEEWKTHSSAKGLDSDSLEESIVSGEEDVVDRTRRRLTLKLELSRGCALPFHAICSFSVPAQSPLCSKTRSASSEEKSRSDEGPELAFQSCQRS